MTLFVVRGEFKGEDKETVSFMSGADAYRYHRPSKTHKCIWLKHMRSEALDLVAILSRHGVDTALEKWKPEQEVIEIIASLRARGKSLRDIAAEVDMSFSNVNYHLQKKKAYGVV